MDKVIAFIVFFVIVFAGLRYGAYRENQCERNGAGKWHYWTQVCEPLRSP